MHYIHLRTIHLRFTVRDRLTVRVMVRSKKSYLYYTRLIHFRVSRVSGAHLRGFAPEPTYQGCNGDESLLVGNVWEI